MRAVTLCTLFVIYIMSISGTILHHCEIQKRHMRIGFHRTRSKDCLNLRYMYVVYIARSGPTFCGTCESTSTLRPQEWTFDFDFIDRQTNKQTLVPLPFLRRPDDSSNERENLFSRKETDLEWHTRHRRATTLSPLDTSKSKRCPTRSTPPLEPQPIKTT